MKWRTCPQSMDIFFFLSFSYFIQSRVSLSVAYLTVANLARLGILVHCQVSVRSQYLVRLLSQCWMTGNRTIHPPFEGLSPPTGIEPTPLQNSASKQLDYRCMPLPPSHPAGCCWMRPASLLKSLFLPKGSLKVPLIVNHVSRSSQLFR